MSLRKSKLSKIVSLFGMAAIVVSSFAFALTTTSVQAAEYDYEWAGQSDWPTVPQGGTATLSLSLKNTGTATWTNVGSNPVRLATVNPADRNSGFYKAGEWDATNRAAVLNEASVAPGEIGTFTFTIVGNPDPGHYPEYFAPVVENITWMDDLGMYPKGKYGIYWDITVTEGAGASGYSASLVSKSDNPTIAPGDSATLEVVVENTGTATWSNTGANPIHLGTWDSQDRSSDFYDVTWLSTNRPTGLSETTVAPGAQGTFEFMVKVPSSKSDGTYTETFNLVAENLAWFNIPVTFTIDVEGVSTGDVTVSLASDTPTGTTLPRGASGVEMAKFKFVGTGTVNSLKIHRYGVGNTAAFSNVYLYQGDERLTNGRSISSSSNMAEFNNIGFEVSGTEYVTVVADLCNPYAPDNCVEKGQHGFEIESSDDVSLSSVSGVFPVTGELFAVGDEKASQVQIDDKTDPANPAVGEHAELAKFKITNGTNDTSLHRITLVQTGTINNDDLSDLELWSDNDGEMIASLDELDGDKANFVLDSPYDMPNGSTRNFTVKGMTSGKSNRTVRFYLEYNTDISVLDEQYGFGASLTNQYNGTGTDYSEVTLEGGDVTIAYSGPATGDISKNGEDEVMLNFAITSSNRDLEVKKVNVNLAGKVAGDKLKSGTTYYFDDIKIRETDSAYTAASTQSAGDVLMGPLSLSSATCGSDADCDLTFSDVFDVNAGETKYLQLTWDVSNDTFHDGTHYYKATIGPWNNNHFRYADPTEWVPTADIVPSGTYGGNYQKVIKSTLDVTLDGAVSSSTVVKKEKDVRSVAFKFSTSKDPITVNQVKLVGYIDGDAATGGQDGVWTGTDNDDDTTTLQEIAQNVRLVHDGSVLATGTILSSGSKNVGSDGTVTFSGMNWDLGSYTTEIVEVWYDVSSTAYTGSVTADGEYVAFDIANCSTDIDATNDEGDTVTPSPAGALNGYAGAPTIYQTVDNTGTLDVSIDGTTRDSEILAAGGTDSSDKIDVATFKFETEREAFDIDDLGFTIDPGSNGHKAVKEVWISWDGNEMKSTSYDDITTGDAKFQNIPDLTVPKNGELLVDLSVVLKKIGATSATEDAYSDTQIMASVDDDVILEAYGASSGELKDQYVSHAAGVEASGNVFDIHRSRPVVTHVEQTTLNDFEAGAYTDKVLYKFTVAADPKGDVEVGEVCFDINASGFVAADLDGWTLYHETSPSTAISNTVNDSAAPCLTITKAKRLIGAGTSETFLLKGTISNNGDGDSLSIRIGNAAGAHAARTTLAGTAGTTFVWSDLSDYVVGARDSDTAVDFINSHEVDYLPLDSTVWYNNTQYCRAKR